MTVLKSVGHQESVCAKSLIGAPERDVLSTLSPCHCAGAHAWVGEPRLKGCLPLVPRQEGKLPGRGDT